ncbi:hypothetical protein LKD27_12255 [Faecalibacterium sp. CLA-AA-H283]|uniref:hypothetical protein n=1 Tax=Faecalibacterium TaxID=216851 RepID=UPI001D0F3A7F|nr:hypothetical protein [Faecalibacterium hominis (ex Afrizal et al. 2022)]MCC2140455.1 hypothetical protein [Faecalibacterium hominis (ex Afrizal et al. 2022)]
MSRAKENGAFLEKCKKRACFLSESVLEYITVRRMSDTNASEKRMKSDEGRLVLLRTSKNLQKSA